MSVTAIARLPVALGSVNRLTWTLADEDTGLAINDASSVQVTVYAADGTTALGGTSWPIAANHVGGSNGDYLCVLPDAVAFVDGGLHVAKMVATLADGTKRTQKRELFGDSRL
jgi:hypothetical protein